MTEDTRRMSPSCLPDTVGAAFYETASSVGPGLGAGTGTDSAQEAVMSVRAPSADAGQNAGAEGRSAAGDVQDRPVDAIGSVQA